MKILIAHDEAFNFIYRANIDALRKIGDVSFFSPLHDQNIPLCDWLYLPGGYPELFAEKLSENSNMLNAIKDYAEDGGRVFAECGGFMYLCKDIDGIGMCDVLPMRATMDGSRLHLGYRQAKYKGMLIRGHEFHYSSVIHNSIIPSDVEVLRIQTNAKGETVDTPIYRYKNVTAGYTHWYWAEVLDK